MNEDITTRLRRDCMSLIADEAADTIERLRAELCTAWEQAELWKDERDEARRECRLLLLGQEVLRGVRDLPAPPDDLVTIVPVPRKEDGK